MYYKLYLTHTYVFTNWKHIDVFQTRLLFNIYFLQRWNVGLKDAQVIFVMCSSENTNLRRYIYIHKYFYLFKYGTSQTITSLYLPAFMAKITNESVPQTYSLISIPRENSKEKHTHTHTHSDMRKNTQTQYANSIFSTFDPSRNKQNRKIYVCTYVHTYIHIYLYICSSILQSIRFIWISARTRPRMFCFSRLFLSK